MPDQRSQHPHCAKYLRLLLKLHGLRTADPEGSYPDEEMEDAMDACGRRLTQLESNFVALVSEVLNEGNVCVIAPVFRTSPCHPQSSTEP